ncbi:MAG: SCO family protein [Anaerolineae bacterium]|nr:SCO family protein [Anaerolineae bacterium]
MAQKQKKPNNNILILAFVFSILFLFGVGIILASVASNPQNQTTTTDVNGMPVPNSDGISVYNPPKSIPNFSMPTSTGETLSLSDFAGKLVVLSFGYTRCPDVCPTNMLEYRKIKRFLGADNAEEVVFLFISVDGERDTPDALREYMGLYDTYYNPSFVGMSGTDETLTPLLEDFGLYYARIENPTSPQDYLVDHTASRFLIDKNGNLSRVYSYTTDARAITRDIISILSNG